MHKLSIHELIYLFFLNTSTSSLFFFFYNFLSCFPFYCPYYFIFKCLIYIFLFYVITFLTATFPFFFFLISPLFILSPTIILPLFLFTGERTSVKAWFDRGAVLHSCESAAQKVLQGKGLQGMKSYMQRQPAPQSSQSRDTQPCNSNPAEVSARSSG